MRRLGAIRAINRLKAEAGYREAAAAEIAPLWRGSPARPAAGTLTNIAARHCGGGAKRQRTGAALAPRWRLPSPSG
jgi:hypothetical protein